jgi:ABC-2 type transport system ATP-binding protein
VFDFQHVTKRYGATDALHDVTLSVPRRSIVGLIGRNGSGKTTFLRHVTGLVLPTSGACRTLGVPTDSLGRDELSRIGVVHQDDPLIEWMRVSQFLRYVSSFYTRWDRDLERALIDWLELDPRARIGTMSPGNAQKLALVAATCHHPQLLLLDEPLSDLDPLARQSVLAMLLDRFGSDDMTIVISSHMLRDIEPVIDRLVCLDGGRVTANDEIDAVRERYAEWIVRSAAGRLPLIYDESYVCTARGDHHQARLLVRDPEVNLAAFRARYDAEVESRGLNLEQIFPLLARAGERSSAAHVDEPAVAANGDAR